MAASIDSELSPLLAVCIDSLFPLQLSLIREDVPTKSLPLVSIIALLAGAEPAAGVDAGFFGVVSAET